MSAGEAPQPEAPPQPGEPIPLTPEILAAIAAQQADTAEVPLVIPDDDVWNHALRVANHVVKIAEGPYGLDIVRITSQPAEQPGRAHPITVYYDTTTELRVVGVVIADMTALHIPRRWLPDPPPIDNGTRPARD